MPIKKPMRSKTLTDGNLSAAVYHASEEGELTALRFADQTLSGFRAALLEFDGCLFERVQLVDCDIDRIHFKDCQFVQCDFSGFRFHEGTLRRVTFEDCRAVGAQFERMTLRDVAFRQCHLDYVGLIDCRFQDAAFEQCRMEHALLYQCTQKRLTLQGCDMDGAEVIGTMLDGVDLSDCVLNSLRSDIACLRGATVSLSQTPVVLGLCGIRVRV